MTDPYEFPSREFVELFSKETAPPASTGATTKLGLWNTAPFTQHAATIEELRQLCALAAAELESRWLGPRPIPEGHLAARLRKAGEGR